MGFLFVHVWLRVGVVYRSKRNEDGLEAWFACSYEDLQTTVIVKMRVEGVREGEC